MALDLDDHAVLQAIAGRLRDVVFALGRIADVLERREDAERERRGSDEGTE